MAPLTFAMLSETNRARASRWHPGFPHDEDWSLADWSNAMCGEAGEAANVVKKIRRHDCALGQGLPLPPLAELRAALAEELADVLLYLDLLTTRAGINLEAAVVAKFDAVSELQGFPERLGAAPGAFTVECPSLPEWQADFPRERSGQ